MISVSVPVSTLTSSLWRNLAVLDDAVLLLDDFVVNGKDENDDDTGGDAEDAARRHDDREDDQYVEGHCHVLRQLRDGLEIKFLL